jgi:hypothetical protein
MSMVGKNWRPKNGRIWQKVAVWPENIFQIFEMKNHICNFLDLYELSFATKTVSKSYFPQHLLSDRIFAIFPATLAGKVRSNQCMLLNSVKVAFKQQYTVL